MLSLFITGCSAIKPTMLTLDANMIGFCEDPGGNPENVKECVIRGVIGLGFTDIEIKDSNNTYSGTIDYNSSTKVGVEYSPDTKVVISVGNFSQ